MGINPSKSIKNSSKFAKCVNIATPTPHLLAREGVARRVTLGKVGEDEARSVGHPQPTAEAAVQRVGLDRAVLGAVGWGEVGWGGMGWGEDPNRTIIGS